MSANEFDCLTNTLLQAGLRIGLPVAFAIPGHVRAVLATNKIDVKDVRAVTIHQCPKAQGIIDYRLEIYGRRGLVKLETFQGSGLGHEHDTYTLYDRLRDGPMKHLHLMH
jgi:hypothetical protein